MTCVFQQTPHIRWVAPSIDPRQTVNGNSDSNNNNNYNIIQQVQQLCRVQQNGTPSPVVLCKWEYQPGSERMAAYDTMSGAMWIVTIDVNMQQVREIMRVRDPTTYRTLLEQFIKRQ